MSIETQVQKASAANAHLLQVLSETDDAPSALAEHSRYIAELKQQVEKSGEKLQQLDNKRVTQLKDHERYRDSHARRFLYKAAGKKDRFAEKAEKEEREYFDVLQDLRQQTTLHENLKTQLSDAEDTKPGLVEESQRHAQAQYDLDALYNSIFRGPTPQFPREDACETDVENKSQLYQQSRGAYEAEKTAIRHLTQGMAVMKQALYEMDRSLSYSRMDMFGGGTMTDMMERNHLSKAQQQMMEANSLVMRAQLASPHVVDLPEVNINQGHIMRDVFFDNIFTDMAFHDEIKRARAEVVTCARAMDTQLVKAKERHDAQGKELQGQEMHLAEARKVLQETRREAFEQVLSSGDLPSYEALVGNSAVTDEKK